MDFMLNDHEYAQLKKLICAEVPLSASQILDLLFYAKKIKLLKDSYTVSLKEGRAIPGELEAVLSANINEMHGILDKVIYQLTQNRKILLDALDAGGLDFPGERRYVVCHEEESAQEIHTCLLHSKEEAETILKQMTMDTHFNGKGMQCRAIKPEEAKGIIQHTLQELTGTP